jgi:CheY-like chemotaxis protein
MRERILLVDDDTLAQDLLKSVLQTRGYVVDTAEDGFAAVRMLRNERYDLALIDYHMPDLDGFASARLLRDVSSGDDGPKLVAVTADNNALSVRPGADTVFDAILPKVVAPQPLISSIEQLLRNPKRDRAIEVAAASWRERGLSGRPKVVAFPVPTREQALALDICFDRATLATADMIVLLDASALETISTWRARAGDFLLPVVDLSGTLATSCDAAFSINDPLSWNAAAEVIIKFAARRALLGRESQRAVELDTRLMAYLFVADRALCPIGDPASKLFIRYPGFFPANELGAVTERLTSRGLLRRTFVDRFHSCGSCHAHRLNVREECLYCRSPQLSEVSLIHHFSCAALKPEDAFRSGKNLICPKCRQHLRHYGSDYDKPGTTLQCGSCGASNSQPLVGFSCQDCGAHTDGEAASTRDVYSFELANEAIARLTAQNSIEFSPRDLPPALEWELKSLSRDYHEAATAIAKISYLKREHVFKTRGTPAFLKLRELFIENLRNVIADLGSVVATEEDDYILLKETDPEELSRLAPSLFEQCEALLAESIGPEFTLIDISGRLAS